VTCQDYERLALAADAEAGRVARSYCLPRWNLEPANPLHNAPGHVSVIIIPRAREGESTPQPGDDLLQHVKTDLERRRLLTTKLHVVGPRYVAVNVQLTLVLKSDALVQDVQERAVK